MWHFPVQFQLTRVVTDIKRDDLEFAASLFFYDIFNNALATKISRNIAES